jgi:hypothetical protein
MVRWHTGSDPHVTAPSLKVTDHGSPGSVNVPHLSVQDDFVEGHCRHPYIDCYIGADHRRREP